jgi:hypothetical protein
MRKVAKKNNNRHNFKETIERWQKRWPRQEKKTPQEEEISQGTP